VRRGIKSQDTGDARIVGDFNLPLKRSEAGTNVELECAGMIEIARVHVETANRTRPRALYRAVHQPAPDAFADKLFG
jgi:hypothetical protein